MKKSELRQIIREEISKVIKEQLDTLADKKNINEGKIKDWITKISSTQLGKAVTQILDRLESLPEVIKAKEEGMKTYKLQKLIRSKATPEEKELLRYVVDYGDKVSSGWGTPNIGKESAVYKVYNSEIGERMMKMGFFIQSMTNRYTGRYPTNLNY